MNPITIPNITIPVIGLPAIGIPSVGFPSASGGGLIWPKGLKKSIKAIYDPAKQGMTNYDVIEAYVEDFTYWTLGNTGITSTPKKIVIPAGTELKYIIAFRSFNSFTDGFHIKYTGNAVITYRYNKEDGTVGTIAINESGIYHLPASVANKGSNDSTIHSLFVFENKENDKSITRTASCGYWSTVNIPDEGISWQTKSKYNNTEIAVGNVTDGRDVLTIGGNNLSGGGNWYGCHSDFLLFNRTLTQEEIDWVKNKIFKI